MRNTKAWPSSSALRRRGVRSEEWVGKAGWIPRSIPTAKIGSAAAVWSARPPRSKVPAAVPAT